MKKYLPIYLIILSMVLLFGTTYALLRSANQGENSYVMNVGLLEVTFVDNQTNNLNLEDAYPMTDQEGLNQENALTILIKNTGNVEAQFDIYIEDTSIDQDFKSVIRHASSINNSNYSSPQILSENHYIRKNIVIGVNEEKTFRVKCWLSENANNTYMDKTFTARIVVDASQIRINYLDKKHIDNVSNSDYGFWPTVIDDVRSDITEVNFVDLIESEIDQRYQAATIKADVTDTTRGGQVLAWLEIDVDNPTKYKMYVASVGITYFSANSSQMFREFANLQNINFENINTSNVTNMRSMFYNCSSLTSLNLSNFNTNMVTDMANMINGCSSLTNLDISSFNLSSSNTTLTTFNYMFLGVPATCQVKVKDTNARDWVLTASNNHPNNWSTSNVIV